MRLLDILTNVKFQGNPDGRNIRNITHDSRKVKRDTLFVAIRGEHVDGHDYVLDAIQNGAAAIVSNGRSMRGLSVPVLQVTNPRETMSRIAANFYQHPSKKMTIVGVTGTNGKTSTTHLLNSILMEKGITSGILGTLGFITPSGMHSTGFTTPESVEIQQLLHTLNSGGINHMVMEVSSHALSMHRVDDVDLSVAVFTNLTPEHLDFHHNMENYFQAKLKLFKRLTADKHAIINADDPYGRRIQESTAAKVTTYGFRKTADLHPVSSKLDLNGIQAVLKFGNKKIQIDSPLIGAFNLENIMAAVASALAMKVPVQTIEKGIRKFHTVPGRMENIRYSGKGKVIVDYAHTPDAIEKVLSLIRDLSIKGSEIITLFGCGGDRDATKRPVMAAIAERLSDKVIITSDNPRSENLKQICRDITAGFTQRKHRVIFDRVEAINTALSEMTENSVILILGKGRDDYEMVNGNKLPHSDIGSVKGYAG